MLSNKQLQNVCLVGKDVTQCRYLAQDSSSWDKWHCLKHKSVDKKKIDKRVNDFISECVRKQVDPLQMAQASGLICGDNCDGYPIFRHIEQGYDKP